MESKVLKWLNLQNPVRSLRCVLQVERTLYETVEATRNWQALEEAAQVHTLWAALRVIDGLALEFGGEALAQDAKSFEGMQRVLAGDVSAVEFWGRWYPRLKKHRLAVWESMLRVEVFAQAA